MSLDALFHLQVLEKENSRLVSDMEKLLEELNFQKQQINSMKNENLKLESDLKNNKVHGQSPNLYKLLTFSYQWLKLLNMSHVFSASGEREWSFEIGVGKRTERYHPRQKS